MTIGTALQVAGLAAGLLGKNKQKKEWDFREQQKLEENRYKWMVKGAQNAGFNPSSVLGAVGGNFANQGPTQSSPMNNLARVGNVLMDFADVIDPVRAETERLNNEILNEELIQIRRQNENPFGGVPRVRSTQSAVKNDATTQAQTDAATEYLGTYQTGLGGTLSPGQLVEDVNVTAGNEQAMKPIYPEITGPSWWPTADYIEQIFGDDNIVTSWHGRLTPPIIAYNSRDAIAQRARDVLKPYRLENNRKADRRRTQTEHRYGQRGGGKDAFMKLNFPTVFD